jgi:hypothetical protein
MDRNIRSESFLCKKWALFSITLISIIWCIVIVVLASKLADTYITKISISDTDVNLNDLKVLVKVLKFLLPQTFMEQT